MPSNSERFRKLHDLAERYIAELARTYLMEVRDAPDAHQGYLEEGQVLKSVLLRPLREDAAHIVITFTTFPGLVVTFGASVVEAFPACGCDECAETFEAEAERFAMMIESTTAGRFIEGSRGLFRQQHQHAFWDGTGGVVREGARTVPWDARRALPGRRTSWQPWPRRMDFIRGEV